MRRGAKRERVLLGARTQVGKLRGRVENEEPPFRANGGGGSGVSVACMRRRVNAGGRLCGGLFALR